MPQLTGIDAFISSPGDCDRERAALHRAIDEYNRVSVPTHQLKVQPFGPAELYPAHGSYAQEGVNRQLEKYDLYIGLWRESAGTPTPNAPSGTVEELRRAFARYTRTRRPWIMPYFWKGSPTDFSLIKDELKNQGWYYHGFDDAEHLRTLFFTHLAGYLRDEYCLPGHSATRLDPEADVQQVRSVLLTFQVSPPGENERKISFERRTVTIGRQPERNDIVLGSDRVHREQGSFTWRDGVVFYADLGGDSQYEPTAPVDDGGIAYGLQTVRIGDGIRLPDGTRIVLRAVVD